MKKLLLTMLCVVAVTLSGCRDRDERNYRKEEKTMKNGKTTKKTKTTKQQDMRGNGNGGRKMKEVRETESKY